MYMCISVHKSYKKDMFLITKVQTGTCGIQISFVSLNCTLSDSNVRSNVSI